MLILTVDWSSFYYWAEKAAQIRNYFGGSMTLVRKLDQS